MSSTVRDASLRAPVGGVTVVPVGYVAVRRGMARTGTRDRVVPTRRGGVRMGIPQRDIP